MTTGDVIFCYSFLLHILLSCSFRPYLFVGHIHSCHIALRTKNQIFLIFYINRGQTRVEFRRKLVTADFFPFFHDFLHFGRLLCSKISILCKIADKITKFLIFCPHIQIILDQWLPCSLLSVDVGFLSEPRLPRHQFF